MERPSSTASATTRESDGVTRLENGYCVVLNQEMYDSESDVAFMHCAKSYRPRTGTEHDVGALKRVFRDKFGCKFEVYKDLSASQIIDTFRSDDCYSLHTPLIPRLILFLKNGADRMNEN